jgi:hypothetical protein
MAEWLLRGTVNTFFRGSIPLDTLLNFFFGRFARFLFLSYLIIIFIIFYVLFF